MSAPAQTGLPLFVRVVNGRVGPVTVITTTPFKQTAWTSIEDALNQGHWPTPAEHGAAGAADAAKHLTDHAPGWLLERLGDAILSLHDTDFTSDDIRRIAGATVDAWLLAEKSRRNCFSGWFTARRKAFQLQRVGFVPSTRENPRGRMIAVWRFPNG